MVTVPTTTSKKKQIDASYTRLSKKLREEAEFTSTTDVNVIFDFAEGTPFANGNTFPVRAGNSTSSGPLRDDVAVGRYRYHVYPMKGGPAADPTIIVTE